MQSTFATVTITAANNATIYIDGQQKGTSSYTGRVFAGLHSFSQGQD